MADLKVTAYLDACGRNGGKPLTGPELERFLPWAADPSDLRTAAPARLTFPDPSQQRRHTRNPTPPIGMPAHKISEYLPSGSRKAANYWQKEFNKQINKIRFIEQVIANFKTWRIMHTDYRRPLATFPETISAVVALHFYATA